MFGVCSDTCHTENIYSYKCLQIQQSKGTEQIQSICVKVMSIVMRSFEIKNTAQIRLQNQAAKGPFLCLYEIYGVFLGYYLESKVKQS